MKHVHSWSEKHDLTIRLRKIKGQVEAIERMVEADANCEDILFHVIVARGTLKSVTEKVLNSHIHLCLEDAASHSDCHNSLRLLANALKRYVS